MDKIIFSNDPYGMNWLRDDYSYAEVQCPADLTYEVKNHQEGDLYFTEFTFTNQSSKPFFTNVDSIGIRFPLEDKYESSDICIPYRCNTHLFCGGNVSYICALRMGGEAPHLGMVLTGGSLDCYSVERDLEKRSNDRGCFILHPSPMELNPKETARLTWVIFPHGGKEDFRKKAGELTRFIDVEANHYVLFPKETCEIRVTSSFEAQEIQIGDKKMQNIRDTCVYEFTAEECGEQVIPVRADGIHTWCRIYVQEPPLLLAEKRTLFISRNQQYQGKCKGLDGAYLIYDNEEKHLYYGRTNDDNAGRERVGMGLLIAKYLQRKDVPEDIRAELESSFKLYLKFVRRELVKCETGEVCNDFGMDNNYKRLYNFTWYSTLFAESYQLFGKKEDLCLAFRIMRAYYQREGDKFYPIEHPILLLNNALKKAGMEEERQQLIQYTRHHADYLLEKDVHYPGSEVNYEQSIVAPAVCVLLQAYILTQEEKYLEGGRRQLTVLEQFNGIQPDYHLYEVAIRHWDGFWFGKRKLYGDTFPHYWSALTGNAFALYAQITKDETYQKKAQDSFRGVLPLFFRDGTASCAYVYPHRVNGVRAEFYDPYANDQDWGLYFNLRYLSKL